MEINLFAAMVCLFYIYSITESIYRKFSTNPICSIILHDYGSLHSFASAGALIGFIFTFMILVVKTIQIRPGAGRIPSIIALNIILMGLLSTLLIVVFNRGRICIDVLG